MNTAEKLTTFTPLQEIWDKVSKGVFMAGMILSDQKSCDCGGKFKQEKWGKYNVPVCEKCGENPKKIRVCRYLPSLDGKGTKVYLRFDENGKKIEDVHDAISLLKSIDKELTSNKFDPRRYGSAKTLEQFKFSAFVKSYLENQEKRIAAGKLTSGGFRDKEMLCRLYLVPYFGPYDLRNITAGKIKEFEYSFSKSERMRDRSIAELSAILGHAFAMEYIPNIPSMPKLKKSKKKNADNFITVEEQARVIENIAHPVYRKMIEVLALYAIRPSELRALQWRDIDFKDGTIAISRHFSDNSILTEGRKSQGEGDSKASHVLPILPKFLEIINDIPRSIIKTDFVFRGKIGEFVAQNVLTRHWNEACKKAKVKPVQMYEGTKHTRLSYLKSLGYTDEQIMLVSGHVSIEMVKRYAQLTQTQRLKQVTEMLSR